MKKNKIKIPVLGFAAFSGTGKTTLLINIIPLFKKRNYRIGVIKHAHHAFDIDKRGKDSYELRKAGASHMLITSDRRWALMVENNPNGEQELHGHIGRLENENVDLILIEGFKSANIPKIELHRASLGHSLICENDKNIIAVACDTELKMNINLPILDINDNEMIVDYIINHFINKQLDK